MQMVAVTLNQGFLSVVLKYFTGLFAFLVITTAQAAEFTEIPSSASGLSYVGETWGASWGDVNGDRYPDIFSSNHRARPSMWRNNGDGTFSDIILQFDASNTYHDFPIADTHGGAWADFDNDGDQDLLVLTGVHFPSSLFVNDGVGIALDETTARTIPDDREGRLATWYDYDSDGLLDFIINNRAPNILIGQTAGNFSDVTSSVGLGTFRTNFGVLTDLDNDDQVELFGIADGDFPAKVYEVNIAPFIDITSNVPSTGLVLDAAVADFNNDLIADIFLVRGSLRPNQAIKVTDGALGEMDRIESWHSGGATSGEKGLVFQANGIITVTISTQLGLPKFKVGATGYKPLDRTFQLDPTLVSDQGFLAHDEFVDQGFYIGFDTTNQEWRILMSPGTLSTRGYIEVEGIDLSDPVTLNLNTGDLPIYPKLYLNTGGSYSDSTSIGFNQDLSCVSTVAGDFDNDMDVDLYMVCRNGIENIINRLFLNDGSGVFTEEITFGAEGVVGAGLVSGAGVGENAIVADYDLDGWLDLYVLNGLLMNPIRVGGPDQLFRNTTGDTSTNHWVEVDLVGTVSNRTAVGSKVLASAGGLTQLREQNGRYHRWSQNHQRLHFGLDQNVTVDIEVRWPNGDVDIFTALAADQLYEATQGLAGSGTGSIAAVAPTTLPAFPAPVSGNECGTAPVDQSVDFPYHFDPVQDQGFFIWKDCATTGDWFIRATAGGGSGIEYDGLLTSNEAFAVVTPFDLESDIVDNVTDTLRVGFSLQMSDAGIDGFDFTVNADADVCLTEEMFSPGTEILLGKSHLPVSLPLDLKTLGACIEISADDVMTDESAGVVSFAVNLSEQASTTVMVDYTIVAGTATDVVDYSTVASTGTLTFLPGETTMPVDVSILQDELAEGVETLSLVLSNASGAFILDNLSDLTITDDEINPCGAPVYDKITEKAFFIWKDCQTSEWYVAATAGGDQIGITHTGSVISTADFVSVTATDIETNDLLDYTTDLTKINYGLQIYGTGEDTFQFMPAAGVPTCLTAAGASGAPVYVGPDREMVSGDISLDTLDACLSLTIDDVTVSEADSIASFTVSLSSASNDVITVDYITQSDSATADADYTEVTVPVTVTFDVGETSKSIDISILQDTDFEIDETYTVQLVSSSNATVTDGIGSGTILDDEIGPCGAPVYDKGSEKALFIWKDCQTGEWFVRITGGGDPAGTFYDGEVFTNQSFLSTTGHDIDSSDTLDYITDPLVIDFYLKVWNNGEDGFQFTPTEDAGTCLDLMGPAGVPVLVGPTKLVVSGAFDLGTLGACSNLPVDISIDDVTVSEADASASFTVSLSAASTNTVTIDYVTQSGTATEDSDYTAVTTPVTLTFDPGVTSLPIDIAIVQDLVVESDEYFTVNLTNATNATIIDVAGIGIITDDEIGACGAPIYDSEIEKALFIWKDCLTGEWTVRITGGGDAAGVFYDGEVFTNQSFVNVTAVELESSDTLDNLTDPLVIDFYLKIWNKGEEGFRFTPTADTGTCLELFGPAGVPVLVGPTKIPVTGSFDLSTLGACSTTPVDITIDDVTVSEADATASFTVSLSAASANTVTVDYVTQSGTATDDSDYTAVTTPVTLTFDPGVTSLPIDIAILQDTVIEGDEAFTITLSNATNATVINGSGLGTITDDEIGACGAPTIDSSTEKALFVWKECQTGEWFVRSTGGGDPAGVFYDGEVITNQSFINVTGYELEASDILDNLTDPLVVNFYLKIWNNGEEGFQFTPTADAGTCLDLISPAAVPVLVGPTKLQIDGAFDLGTLGLCTIIPVDVSIDDVTVNEADALATFTVSLSAVSGNTVTVDYVTQSGTATDDVDFTAVTTPVTLTFNSGVTSLPVEIVLLPDSEFELDEDFTINLSEVTNAVLVDATGQATILEDDIGPCGIPTFDKATEKALFLWKDCLTGEWTVRVTGGGDPVNTNFTGQIYSGQNIGSVAGYSLEGNDTLDNTTNPMRIDFLLKVADTGQDGFLFTPVADNGTCLDFQNVGIPVIVGATRVSVTGVFDLGTLAACTNTPTDIMIDDVSVSEADATASFTVTLSDASAEIITVDYVTQSGSAIDDLDYTGVLTASTLTFNPGVVSLPIDISLLQDTEFEVTETFEVVLSAVTNATIVDGTGLGTISDDDIGPCGIPTFDKATEKALFLWKDCLTGEWTVRVTGGGDPVNTDFTGQIYSTQNIGSVTGFSLEVNDTLDNSTDPTRIDFLLKVADTGQDGFLFTPTADNGTCLDLQNVGIPVLVGATRISVSEVFDLGSLAACINTSSDISIDDVSVSEADATASFTVTLSDVSTEIVTVDYMTQSGSAIDDLDYTAVLTPATLTFNPGVVSLPIDISLLQDTEFEVTETFEVVLSEATNAMIIDGTGLGTISDDDIGPCGAPVYDKATEKALFIWKDCQTGLWSVRVTGGGDPVNTDFVGQVYSDQNINNVQGAYLETSDVLDYTTDPMRIDYLLKSANTGQDGFEFAPTSDAGTCFDSQSAGIPVMLGSTRIAMTGPFDLGTLGGCLSINIEDIQANESDAFATFTVTLSGTSASPITVDYTTAEDTSNTQGTLATDGLDYSFASGSLTFNPGETSKTVDVTLVQDAFAEGAESFAFNLTNAVNASLGTSTSTGVIIDDEIDPCGMPTFDSGIDQGAYLWRDCGTDTWHLMTTGGGSPSQILYQGDVVSDMDILDVVNNSIETNDVLNSNTNTTIVDFKLKMKTTGSDGFDFTLTNGASACFTLTSGSAGGGNALVGAGQTVVATPFELSTLGVCN